MVNLEALYSSMKSNMVKAAALDVLPVEPNDDSQRLIVALEQKEDWIHNRLIVTPHTAFYSPEAFVEMRESAAKEALRVLVGQDPQNKVN